MFLQPSVILLMGGGVCLSACWDTHPSPRADTPPGPDTPLPPQRSTPPEQTPPGSRPPWEQTPPREADSSIRSTRGRYASYWNAFLFWHSLTSCVSSTKGMHSTHYKTVSKMVLKMLLINQAACRCSYHPDISQFFFFLKNVLTYQCDFSMKIENTVNVHITHFHVINICTCV